METYLHGQTRLDPAGSGVRKQGFIDLLLAVGSGGAEAGKYTVEAKAKAAEILAMRKQKQTAALTLGQEDTPLQAELDVSLDAPEPEPERVVVGSGGRTFW